MKYGKKDFTMGKSCLKVNDKREGESIEQKMRRIVDNKEPIKDGAPIIHTERKEGVRPEFNIRTDRFEIAVEGTTKIEKSYKARRENKALKIDRVEPTQGGTSTEVIN